MWFGMTRVWASPFLSMAYQDLQDFIKLRPHGMNPVKDNKEFMEFHMTHRQQVHGVLPWNGPSTAEQGHHGIHGDGVQPNPWNEPGPIVGQGQHGAPGYEVQRVPDPWNEPEPAAEQGQHGVPGDGVPIDPWNKPEPVAGQGQHGVPGDGVQLDPPNEPEPVAGQGQHGVQPDPSNEPQPVAEQI